MHPSRIGRLHEQIGGKWPNNGERKVGVVEGEKVKNTYTQNTINNLGSKEE